MIRVALLLKIPQYFQQTPHTPGQPTARPVITYEYPLHERIRTLLRLEDLYGRVTFFLGQESAHAHHACLTGMFEIVDVASRFNITFLFVMSMIGAILFLIGIGLWIAYKRTSQRA